MHLNFEDIVLVPQGGILDSRKDANISATLGNWEFAVPVVAANMQSIITAEVCKQFDNNNWFYVYHRIGGTAEVITFTEHANKEFNKVSISVGVKDEWIEAVKYLHSINQKVDYFTVDIAHSHSLSVIPILQCIKKLYPNSYTICGNGCTKEWVEFLESLTDENKVRLVDCVKVGIGVSKSCRTREYTGFGSSTIGSLKECNDAARHSDIMSDGGITINGDTVCIGDIAKAIAFGADWVMSGALFSRCIDSPAVLHGYYGNASRQAKGNDHVEGELVKVQTNGLTIKEMMKLIEDSLRSSVSYGGKEHIYELYGAKYEVIK